MNTNEFKLFIETIANKDQSGDSVSPADFNLLIAQANEAFFSRQYEYYQVHQVVTDALKKFIIPLPITKVAGAYPLPADYVHLSSVSFTKDGIPRVVTMVTEEQLSYLLDHPIKNPTEKYPYGTFTVDKINVYPDTISQVTLTYLRKPADPVWGYTIVNDQPVYNPATSVQLEFDPIYHRKIAEIMLSYMGIDFRDDELQAYAERAKGEA